MNALSTHDISMAPWWAVVIALLLVGVGAALQYRIGLELDDHCDAKDLERDQDQSLEIAAYESPVRFIPAQRDGGAS